MTTITPALEAKPTIGIAAVMAENLYAALQSVGTAIVNKPALPILANVALIAENSTITLIASDCQNTQVVKISAKVDIPFEITLPFRTLRDVMALASPERLDITVNHETSIAHMENGSWKCNLKGMPFSEYPPVAKTNDDATMLAIVDYEKLLELANIGKRHAAKNDNRPVLQSARIRITPDKLQYTTANGDTVFDATMTTETEDSANYEMLVPAETLYKALTAAKKNPRLKDYVGLYGTRIDENGRVNGLLFIEDSPISVMENCNYPNTNFLDNATPVGKINDTQSVYKAIWGYKKANRLEFRGYPGIKGQDIPEVNIAFITDDKNGESHRIDKGFTMLLDTHRFAIHNGTIELAEYLRHASKNAIECQIQRGKDMIIFSHDHAGGYMRVAFIPHQTGTNISKECHKREHAPEKFSEVAEQTIPQTIETNAIRFENSGFEYTGKRIVHYRLIEGEKAYTCQLTDAIETWDKLQKEFARRTLPKITIKRPAYFKSEDYWRNAGIGSIQMLSDAIERLAFSFGLTDQMPATISEQFLNTDESHDYTDVWAHIDTSEIVIESTVEAQNTESGIFSINAKEIGFDFDLTIKVDREPETDKDWQIVSQFVEENFPLSSDDVSHGYSQTSCMVYLPESEIDIEAQNWQTDYEIKVLNADSDDMILIALELADHKIPCTDGVVIIGGYLRHSHPGSIFVLSVFASRTVEIINGLGFQTDEDTPDPSPDNDESPSTGDSPIETKNTTLVTIQDSVMLIEDDKIITPDPAFFQQAPQANNTTPSLNSGRAGVGLQDAFKSIGFDPSTIYGVFEYVDIADKFIEDTIRKYPDRAPELWDTFKLLQPSTKMMKMHHKVYDHHIRELMQRVLNGDDLKPATRAEIQVEMSEVSQVIPIHNRGAFLFSRLFKQIFGATHRIVQDIDTVALNEPYKGAADEMESELRHKLRNEDRPKPDVNRWHESVCDEKKAAILGRNWRKYA